MFNVNDKVVYAAYGVCNISAVESRDFGGGSVEYYVLRPVSGSSNTFYVPTSGSGLESKMRKVISREEAEELIREMPDEPLIWIENEIQRREAYKKIIDSGDRRELVKLIKTLCLHRKELVEKHKKLRSTDERFLAEAENMLYDEFSYALGIPREEVISYIRSHVSE